MLGEIIKKHISKNKSTQAKFADEIGISERMLRFLIAGFKTPSVPVLKRISEITGKTMDELTKDMK